MDLDSDGCISIYELEAFYNEQMTMLNKLDIEPLPFNDILCQSLDMVNPTKPDYVTLADLKRSSMAHVFFNTFLNTSKYLEFEQRDPFEDEDIDQTLLSAKVTDWDRWAAEEYEALVLEEQQSYSISSEENEKKI